MDRNNPLFQLPSVVIGIFEASAAHRKATGATHSIEAFHGNPTPASERYRLCDFTGPKIFAYDLCAYLQAQWVRIRNHNLKGVVVPALPYVGEISLCGGEFSILNVNSMFSQMFDGFISTPVVPNLSAFLNVNDFVIRLRRASYDDPYNYNVYLVPDDLGVNYNFNQLGGYRIGTLDFTGEPVSIDIIEAEVEEVRAQIAEHFFETRCSINPHRLNTLVVHVRNGEVKLDRMRFAAQPEVPAVVWRSLAA